MHSRGNSCIQRRASYLALLFSVLLPALTLAAPKSLTIEGVSEQRGVTLRGPDSCWQLVVTLNDDNNRQTDVTSSVSYQSTPAGIVQVESTGMVRPLAEGAAKLTITSGSLKKDVTVSVLQFKEPPQLSFFTDVAPLFSRYSCNTGSCHGKKGGQEGFELALFGFEAELDYERLLEADRVEPDDPEESYLLQKATKHEPHEGGQRFKKDSPPYRLLRRWIEQGALRGEEDDAIVTSIEVVPSHRTLERNTRQQLTVLGQMSDGTVRNLTNMCYFQSNQEHLTKVTAQGVVEIHETAGVASVMIRYQTHVGVFRVVIPTGNTVEKLPKPRGFVDELVFAQYKTLGIPPSNVCDDRTFIRRATSDIVGRLPTPEEVATFVADQSDKKDAVLIDRLIADDGYADYFANKWGAVLRNRRATAKDDPKPTAAFHAWIRDGLRNNRPYDQFVRDVLTASGQSSKTPQLVWYREANEMSVQLEDTSQLFLGQRLQCARCHHHPQEKWSEADYYGMAAFFSRIEVSPKSGVSVSVKKGKWEATHPKTKKLLPPKPLDDAPFDGDADPRNVLVDWMTRPDNPFFAKALANRYWKHFLGRALVEPEDDMRATNPPTNPALLDALAEHFVKSKYDLKSLVRVICLSHAYRLSSDANEFNLSDEQNYSRFMPRRLQAEVLLDAIDVVTQSKSKFANVAADTRATQLPDNQTGSYFLKIFGRPDAGSVCECERSGDATLAQLLHLMNSNEVLEKVRGKRATSLAQDKRSHEERIAELYQVALSREPNPEELKALLAYLQGSGSVTEEKPAAKPEPKADGPIQIVAVSGDDSGTNGPMLAFDGKAGTRWSVDKVGSFLQVELNQTKRIDELRLGFDKGERRYKFDLLVSADGKKWAQVASFQSNGKGNNVESFRCKPTDARFVRIVHQGNSANNWSNTHTVEIAGVTVAKDLRFVEADQGQVAKTNSISKSEPVTSSEANPYADIIWALINTKEFMFNH